MSVTPGAQRGNFNEKALKHINESKKHFKNTKLRVDGGINPTNLQKLNESELNILKLVDEVCVGSYLLD